MRASIAFAIFVSCGCEPRAAELSFEQQTNDWILISSNTRAQLIHRTGDEYDISSPYSAEELSSDTINFTDDEERTLIFRFEESALNRLHGFVLGTENFAQKLEVVAASDRSKATCHCNRPQSPQRTLVADGAACPMPEPREVHEYDPSSGSFTVLGRALSDEEKRWVVGLESESCASFLGTETLLDSSNKRPFEVEPAVGLTRAVDTSQVALAGGEEDFVVFEPNWVAYASSADSAFIPQDRQDIRSLEAPIAASAVYTDDGVEFWLLHSGETAGFQRALFKRGADSMSRLVRSDDLIYDQGLDDSADTLWRRVSPSAVLTRTAAGDLVLTGEIVDGEPKALVALSSEPGDENAELLAWPLPAGQRVLSASAGMSTWIAWSNAGHSAWAWIMPASGHESAMRYASPDYLPGELEALVALDEDRIVLAFANEGELELWEWLQLPITSEHPYDATCERGSRSFCLRPFPTNAQFDGRVDCPTAATTDLVHAWARPNAGVGLLYADGHVWRSGQDCALIDALSSAPPLAAANTQTGRLLIMDMNGDYWVSTEES